MKNFINSLAKWQIIVLTIVIMFIIVLSARWLVSFRFLGLTSGVNREDYRAVAEDFIKTSGFIAHEIGKVTEISHIGKGGATGKESYNVYKVRGEETTGVINLTLTRDNEDRWFVTSADLSTGGKVFTVPIKRSEGKKWQRFKLR